VPAVSLARSLPHAHFSAERIFVSKELAARDKRVKLLANAITALMRKHTDRGEAIDAYDMARIAFRKPTSLRPYPQVPTEYLQERI
jgi:hypothetical protein